MFFTRRREHSSRCSPVQVGLTRNNGSYPHEDTSTVTGCGGNSSGSPWIRIGSGASRTWETGGEQARKEMKIQECQIAGEPLNTPLGLPDAHLPGIFSTHSFSGNDLVPGK